MKNTYLKEQQKMLEMFENKKKEDEMRQMSVKQSIPQALSPPTNQHITPALTPPKNQQTYNPFDTNTSFQPQQPQTSSGKLSDDLLQLSAGSSSAFTMNQQNTAFQGMTVVFLLSFNKLSSKRLTSKFRYRTSNFLKFCFYQKLY